MRMRMTCTRIALKGCALTSLVLLFGITGAWSLPVSNTYRFEPFSGCFGGDNITHAAQLPRGNITVTWDAVPDAKAYNVYYGTRAGLKKWNCVKIPGAVQPLTLTDFPLEKAYFFGVTAVTGDGESEILGETRYEVREKEGSVHLANAPARL